MSTLQDLLGGDFLVTQLLMRILQERKRLPQELPQLYAVFRFLSHNSPPNLNSTQPPARTQVQAPSFPYPVERPLAENADQANL